jgi:hypothetical protein
MREHGREIGPVALQDADTASSGDGRASYATGVAALGSRTAPDLPGKSPRVIIKGLPGT